MHHVFISYSRLDRDWVEQLVQRLRNSGVSVWIDQQDILVSLPWFQEVSDAIDAADVFLICDSPRWRVSSSCHAEHEIAERADKAIMSLAVGEPIDVGARQVAASVHAQGRSSRRRVELLVLARDWDRAGRPRGTLVSRRSARLLARSATTPPPLGPTERAFLRASRARARRRLGIALSAGLALVVCLVSWAVISAVRWNITRSNAAQAVAYAEVNSLLSNEQNDPVRALSAATRLGVNESGANAVYVTRAFSQPMPDDAFTVTGAARRFVQDPVVADVVIADATGRTWHRAATARDVRTAASGPGRDATAAPRRNADIVVRADPRSGAVLVQRAGGLWRRIWFHRHVTALSVSPNGRELAAAAGNAIAVADLERGVVKTKLRGRGDRFVDVAWSADSARIWAIGHRQVVSWTARDGTVLRDSPARRFEAVLAGTTARTAWVVAHSGGLEQVDVRTGAHLRSLRVPDEIESAAGSPDGRMAAVSGKHGLWLVSLTDGRTRRVSLPGCSLGRSALPGDGTVAVPCVNGKVHRLDVTSGKALEAIRVSPSGAFAVRALPRTRSLLISDTLGLLYLVAPGANPRLIYESFCGGSITRIATSPDGRVIVPAGAGTGINGCTRRMRLRGNPAEASGWQMDALMEDVDDHVAQTAAISRQGHAFAFGFEDGTIVLHPTANITPTRTITTIDGPIRDMLVTADNQLLVATSTGTLTRIPFCETCLSNRVMAGDARKQLDRLIALGIAKSVRRRGDR